MIEDPRARRRLHVAVSEPALAQTVVRLATMAGLDPHCVGPRQLGPRTDDVPVVIDAAGIDLAAADWAGSGRVLVVTAEPATSQDWQRALAVRAERLLVLPADQRSLLEWLQQGPDEGVDGRLICCVSGRGGAGASTFAAALALAAADAGSRALLVDLDPDGGGQDLLLGIERAEGFRWPALVGPDAAIDVAAAIAAAPTVARLSVLTGAFHRASPLSEETVRAVASRCAVHHELVVADLPRSRERLSAALPAAAVAVVVVAPDVRGVAAATHVVGLAREHCRDVRVVVRKPRRGQLRAHDVADAVSAPVIAEWPWDRRLAGVVDTGAFAVRWRGTGAGAVARTVLDRLREPSP